MRFPFSVGQGNAESSKRRERKDVPWSSDVCSSDLMRSKVSNVVLSEPGTGWPVLRMNAVPLLSWPRECRKFEAKRTERRPLEFRRVLFRSDALESIECGAFGAGNGLASIENECGSPSQLAKGMPKVRSEENGKTSPGVQTCALPI